MEFTPKHFVLRSQGDSGLPFEDQSANNEVAIYNEDDLSHYLFVDPHREHHHHDSKHIINEVRHKVEHPSTGSHTPMSEDNDYESAILSDCESETDPDDLFVLPPSPTRPRGGSFGSEDFEFPIFLGRQEEEPVTPPPVYIHPILRGKSSAPATTTATHMNKKVKIMQPDDGVIHISGPLMSWWPAPVETMEYEWADDKKTDAHAVSVHHHVSNIEGPLMTWWPPMMDMMEHEWVEKFYE